MTTKNLMAREKVLIGLVLIFVLALALRFWGIWFGLPFSFRADEYHEVFRALELGTGSFNFERTGKGGYFYVLFVEYGILFVALKLGGIIDTAQDFGRYFVQDPSAFYFIGRATTAVIGTVNVFLAYRIGVRAYGFVAGILAAVFLAVDFLNAEHSHFVTVDVPMTCLATAALLFAVRMVTEGRPSDYKWAAFFAALATSTKLPAILLLIPLLLAHYYVVRSKRGGLGQFFLARDLWWSVVIFAVALAVTNPGIVVNPPLSVLSIFTEIETTEGEVEETLSVVVPNLYVYYLDVMAESMGWPLFVVCMAGALYALWKRTPTDVILVSFAMIFYLVFASVDSHLYYPRYILLLLVILALFGGRLLQDMWPEAGTAKKAVAVAVVAVLAAIPASRTVANNHYLTQTDTRALAREWFDQNIPSGSKVMIEGLKVEPSRLTVPLPDTVENMRSKIEYYKTREPAKAKYLSYLVQVDAGSAYDLELVKRTELQTLDFYKKQGVQYFVIRPEAFEHSRRMGSTGRDFLDALKDDPTIGLLKTFDGDPKSRPGPDIEIYEAQSNARNSAP